MPHYVAQGSIPQKRHITFYKPDGQSLYREELFSTVGFSGPYSNRYRLRMPTRMLNIQEFKLQSPTIWEAPMQWHLFHTDREKKSGDLRSSLQPLMFNTNVNISTSTPDSEPDHFFKNAYTHELVFVHRGEGTLCTEFGDIAFRGGDYLVIPKGVIYQIKFESLANNKLFIVESSHPFLPPKHYLNSAGQLAEDAPYCERDLRPPVLKNPIDQKGKFEIHVKAGDKISVQTLDHHPFDVIGWDGCEYPFALSIHDFAAKVGQIHLPPPVHLVFATPHFVVCNFVPRLFDFHPQAIPAPYFHTNVDSDEVLYYVDGNFMSRKGVEAGSITLHPMGIPHGPQPGKTESSIGQKETQEFAVMIDTFAPLTLTQTVKNWSDPAYSKSWLEETT